jgi:hypothetical protein
VWEGVSSSTLLRRAMAMNTIKAKQTTAKVPCKIVPIQSTVELIVEKEVSGRREECSDKRDIFPIHGMELYSRLQDRNNDRWYEVADK